jgi:hypothetical protein
LCGCYVVVFLLLLHDGGGGFEAATAGGGGTCGAIPVDSVVVEIGIPVTMNVAACVDTVMERGKDVFGRIVGWGCQSTAPD